MRESVENSTLCFIIQIGLQFLLLGLGLLLLLRQGANDATQTSLVVHKLVPLEEGIRVLT